MPSGHQIEVDEVIEAKERTHAFHANSILYIVEARKRSESEKKI